MFSDRGDYATFHLRAEVKLSGGADSGIFFWTPFDIRPSVDGQLNPAVWHEANINNDAAPFTGSLDGQGCPPVRKTPARPDEWFVLEVERHWQPGRQQGKRKHRSATYVSARPRGHIALQGPDQPSTTVQFRTIEIKVPAERAGEAPAER